MVIALSARSTEVYFGADLEFVMEDGNGLFVTGDDVFLDSWDGAVEGGLGKLATAVDKTLLDLTAAFGHLAAEITDVIGWAAGVVTE